MADQSSTPALGRTTAVESRLASVAPLLALPFSNSVSERPYLA